MNVLLIGGAGYIGSHIYVELFNNSYNPVILDNFSNSKKDVLTNLEKITGTAVNYFDCDITKGKNLKKIIVNNNIEHLIILAAKKSIEESILQPIDYYNTNIVGLINILKSLDGTNCKNIIYSSSACVYGSPKSVPIKETHLRSSKNPYGMSKIIAEDILNSYVEVKKDCNLAILRYFNPAGNHNSGLIGESTENPSKNLFPNIEYAVKGEKEEFLLFGSDYNTKDGTCVRDFIHIEDLASGHCMALKFLINNKSNITVNLGSGKGYSILEILNAYQRILNKEIKIRYCDRRPGDVGNVFSDISKAKKKIGWEPKRNLDEMIKSSLKYIK